MARERERQRESSGGHIGRFFSSCFFPFFFFWVVFSGRTRGLMGVPAMQAPGEAECLCATLASAGMAKAAATEDGGRRPKWVALCRAFGLWVFGDGAKPEL